MADGDLQFVARDERVVTCRRTACRPKAQQVASYNLDAGGVGSVSARRNGFEFRLLDELELTERGGRPVDPKLSLGGVASASLGAPRRDCPIPGGYAVARLASAGMDLEHIAADATPKVRGGDVAEGESVG